MVNAISRALSLDSLIFTFMCAHNRGKDSHFRASHEEFLCPHHVELHHDVFSATVAYHSRVTADVEMRQAHATHACAKDRSGIHYDRTIICAEGNNIGL